MARTSLPCGEVFLTWACVTADDNYCPHAQAQPRVPAGYQYSEEVRLVRGHQGPPNFDMFAKPWA